MTTTRPKIKVASVINGKYLAFRKLGEGGCGVIYEVAMVKCPARRFACKAETPVSDEDPTLPMEHKVISLLNEKNSLHCVEMIEKGHGENYQFLVMTLLGPSLDAIRATLPTNKFSSYSTLVMAIQALDSLQEIHQIGYVHRDVKPANFAIGALGTPKQRLIHVLDFGIARQYMTEDADGVHFRQPRKLVPFRGTLRYCSVNAQDRKEQGRHDDLWSLFYMIVEFLKGNLPWSGISEEEKVMVMKNDFKELFNGLDHEIISFAHHLSVLRYKLKPDYQLLRDLLLNVFIKNKFKVEMKVDWEKGGRYDRCFEKQTSLLPAVTEKDMSEVDLAKLLKVPEKRRKISQKEVVAAGKMKDDDGELNTAQDDTIIEGEVNVSHSKPKSPMSHGLLEHSKKTKRRFIPKTPSQQTVETIEMNWKRKEEEARVEKMIRKAAAERRAKTDIIVQEDNTVMKRKGASSVSRKTYFSKRRTKKVHE